MTDLSEVFSVDDVNERLPLVSRVMEDLREAWVERRETRRRLRHFRRAAASHSSPEIGETLGALEQADRRLDGEILALEQEIHQIGGIVKDPGRGVVNFFSEQGGSLVFLSWMLGEESVGYWHDLDGGTAERRMLRAQTNKTGTPE